MDLHDSQKIFKIKDDIYVLNIYDKYIMLSKNASNLTFSKQLQAVIVYFKLENYYTVRAVIDGNTFNNMSNMTIVDDFKALLFLDKYFQIKWLEPF